MDDDTDYTHGAFLALGLKIYFDPFCTGRRERGLF